MYCLRDEHIDFIMHDIRTRGIRMESLQYDLLDHICVLIEQNLEDDGDFEQFYKDRIKTFYKLELREIEEETQFLINSKHHWVLSRGLFFLLLFAIFVGPFIFYDLSRAVFSAQSAGWQIPARVWEASLVFSLFPLLILLVLLLTPDRFDPLIPRNSRILIGFRPFIKIIPPSCAL